MPTHTVDNQPPLLENYNLFETDRTLVGALAQQTPAASTQELVSLGELAGRADTIALGFDANEHPPELHTHDRFGNRIDEVVFHPAWHRLMQYAAQAGLAGAPWRDQGPYPHVRRAAKFYIWGQVESGHGCPISMTYAAVPVIRTQPELAALWLATAYLARLRSAACQRDRKIGRALRYGNDGEARRLGRTRIQITTRAVPVAEAARDARISADRT